MSYIYDSDGTRFYFGDGGAGSYAVFPLPGGAKVYYDSTGTASHYMQGDFMGSARLGSNSDRTLYFSKAYAPFGESYSATTGSEMRNYFGGYWWDTAGPQGYEMTYRRYSPVQGRWLSPDPAGLAAVDMTNPQSLNRYAYVLNSPTNYIDPLGLADCVRLPDGSVICWEEVTGNPIGSGSVNGGGSGGGGTGDLITMVQDPNKSGMDSQDGGDGTVRSTAQCAAKLAETISLASHLGIKAADHPYLYALTSNDISNLSRTFLGAAEDDTAPRGFINRPPVRAVVGVGKTVFLAATNPWSQEQLLVKTSSSGTSYVVSAGKKTFGQSLFGRVVGKVITRAFILKTAYDIGTYAAAAYVCRVK